MIHKASRLEIKVRNRCNTASVVAAAAYIAGGRYRCDRTGRIKNYSRRRDVVSVESVKMPHDPARVFNAANAAEKHPRARLAREFVVSLPHELPLDVQRKLVRGFCLWLHDQFGLSSLAAIHHPYSHGIDREILEDMSLLADSNDKQTKPRHGDRGNPLNQHVHILCPTRQWCEEAQAFGKKVRALDDKKTGPLAVQMIRDEWQRRVNRSLEKQGVKGRVDLRSYEKMAAAGDAPAGLARQQKMGPRNTARARRRVLEARTDDTFLGRSREAQRSRNEELWSCWMAVRALHREKSRLEESERLATEAEAARRARARAAEKQIEDAESDSARAAAIEAAPHLDALSPMQQAIAWARGEIGRDMGSEEDPSIDPETETFLDSESPSAEQDLTVKELKKLQRRLQRQHQRQRQRSRGSDG